MNQLAENYLDLVIKVVRGMTPIPEYNQVVIDRRDLASHHIEKLKAEKKIGFGKNLLHNMVVLLGSNFLNKSWNKLSPTALSMCGTNNIELLVKAMKDVDAKGIEGDFIETGVWRGGLTIIMRAYLNSVNNRERKVWIADSFEGLPSNCSDPKDQAAHLLLEPLQYLSSSKKQVEDGLKYFGLLDDQVQFLHGWFEQTLPAMPAEKLSLIRLDGDYYESTKVAIESLYPKLSVGGYVIVDDYHLPLGCKRAIDEYRTTYGITDTIHRINKQSVYWVKEKLCGL